jgi:hypothetical protein
LVIEARVNEGQNVTATARMIRDLSEGRTPLEDEAEGCLYQRTSEEPTTGGEEVGAFYERFDTQK